VKSVGLGIFFVEECFVAVVCFFCGTGNRTQGLL
jgi:hypothetical protein